MTAVVIAAPVKEPVSVADMRAHLRISGTQEDDVLTQFIRAARCQVEQETRRALIRQRWRLYLDDWPQGRILNLPVAPVLSVERIELFDLDGQPHILQAGDWRLDQSTSPARIRIKPGAGVPAASLMGIEVDFTAGYGSEPADVPEPLRQSVRLLAAHWFEHREAGTELAMASLPHGFDRLMSVNRVPRL